MAMGKKKQRQETLWVATSELPVSPGHPFYSRLNEVLGAHGFDGFAARLCRRFYAPGIGRPSVPPGRYFRLMLVGYFEGLDSERAIAWRAADSLGIRSFLGLGLDERAPDHSTISRNRRLIAVETHEKVFTWVLERLAGAGLVRGKTIGIDATTLEANAAMRSIVRRDTGESYQVFLSRLAKASGIKTPTREALARLDRRRKGKASNDDWTSPSDPDAKITKMKDGRTHLAHKAEHAVDLETGAIVAVTVQGADKGDTRSLEETLDEVDEQLGAVGEKDDRKMHPSGFSELVLDKGYHSSETLIGLEDRGLRAYVSEPDRGRRKWNGDIDAQMAVYDNRRRVRGERGRRLHRLRGELLERPCAHLYETGAMRRTHLRGHSNIRKRLLIHTAACNLGLLMRDFIGVGTPRALQGLLRVLSDLLRDVLKPLETALDHLVRLRQSIEHLITINWSHPRGGVRSGFTTGC